MVLYAIDKPGPSTASCSFPHFLPPSSRKKRFHSWSLYELLSINKLDLIAKPKDWMSAFRIRCPRILMDITWQNRVKGVVSFVKRTVAWFLRLVTFDCICNVSLYIILTELNLWLCPYLHVEEIMYYLIINIYWCEVTFYRISCCRKVPYLAAEKLTSHSSCLLSDISIFVFRLANAANCKHWVSECSPWDTIKMLTNI